MNTIDTAAPAVISDARQRRNWRPSRPGSAPPGRPATSHHRHDAADRRRVAVRGGRPARGLEGAGRRGRQRQLLARGGPPLVRGHVDRLRARRCSRTAAAAPRPSGCRSGSRRPTPRRCRSRDGSFDVVLSSFGVMFAPNHVAGGQRAAARLPARGTHRPGELDAARIHRAAVRGRRPPRAAAGGADAAVALGHGGAPRTSCSARRRPTSARPIAISCSAIARRSTGSTCSGPGTARCTRRSAGCREGQARLEQDLIELIDEFNSSGDSTMVVPAEYLEVVVVKK